MRIIDQAHHYDRLHMVAPIGRDEIAILHSAVSDAVAQESVERAAEQAQTSRKMLGWH